MTTAPPKSGQSPTLSDPDLPPGLALPPRRKAIVMAAVMVSIFAVAMNLTIVNVALPRIVADLGGLDLFAWPVTAYLLASTAPMPLAGKLGDVFGRKPLIVVGLVIFIGGTAITGLASSMEQLIVFRAVQGVGGGLIMAAAFTTVGDFFAPADRGRWQGLFAAVFALSLVIAPLVGGSLTDYLSWRWVFFVNLPVAAIALAVVLWGMPWFRPRTRRPIDYRGGLLLIAATVPLLVGLSWAGNQYGWTEGPVLIAFVIGAAAILLFLLFERRRPDGVLPLSLFRNRVFVVSTLIAAIVGVGMFGVMQFLPLFIQGVQGESATSSGTVMMPMAIGIVLGAALTGQIMSRGLPYRPLAVGAALTASLGIFLLSSLSADSGAWAPRGYMVVFGLGMGAMLPLITVSVQNALPYRLMGVGTASTQFFRQIGGTLGVAVFGSIMFATLATGLSESTLPGIDLLRDRPQILLDPDALSSFQETLDARIPGASAPAIEATRVALGDSITNLFQIAGAIMALAAVVALFLPQPRLRTREELMQQAGVRPTPTPTRADPSPVLVLAGMRAPQHGAGQGAAPRGRSAS